MTKIPSDRKQLPRVPTGIVGLDEITTGGLPKGRPTLICGGPGCGKTLLGMEFLVRGATQFNEAGVFMSFEETGQDLAKNVASLGFNLKALQKDGMLVIDHVVLERGESQEAGEYDLEGLFIRLGNAIDTVKAKRVVLDTVEALFGNFEDQGVLRSELRRLFAWLRKRGVTTVITGEKGEASLTRQGLEEYVSDCVILLENRVVNQLTTRSLRVVKYRGALHGTNEYPFLIDESGISVLPITSMGLQSMASDERVSTGIARLDTMLSGKGLFRGSSVLVSGSSGTGKSTIAATFVDAACKRGEKCIYFAFEESESQIIRNMRSVGIDLAQWVRKDLLRFHAVRPSANGLEMHVATMHKAISEFGPKSVVVDPISGIGDTRDDAQVKNMVLHITDFLKARNITAVFTALTVNETSSLENSDIGISSLIDSWILVRNIETDGERNRALFVIKSRGMPHSNQVREFVLTDHGAELRDVYIGPQGMLTGSARLAREAEEVAATKMRNQETELKQRELDQRRRALESQVIALRDEFAIKEAEAERSLVQARQRETILGTDRTTMGEGRGIDLAKGNPRRERPLSTHRRRAAVIRGR